MPVKRRPTWLAYVFVSVWAIWALVYGYNAYRDWSHRRALQAAAERRADAVLGAALFESGPQGKGNTAEKEQLKELFRELMLPDVSADRREVAARLLVEWSRRPKGPFYELSVGEVIPSPEGDFAELVKAAMVKLSAERAASAASLIDAAKLLGGGATKGK